MARLALGRAPSPEASREPGPLPPELFRRIRKIEIRTRRLANDYLLGEYRSVFKGGGLEFMEVREYQPGDDVRSIDWNVTARMGRPFIKKFAEERELIVFFVVDASASQGFGTALQSKREITAEICAMLAFAAINNNDKVGLLLYTGEVERFVPPRKGRQHVLRLLRELLYWRPRLRTTDTGKALVFLHRIARKRSVVFLLSDFLDEGYLSPLRLLSHKHDVIAISVTDPRELELPPSGLLELEDAETGERCLVDAADPGVLADYRALVQRQREARHRLLRGVQADEVEVITDRSYVRALLALFEARARRP